LTARPEQRPRRRRETRLDGAQIVCFGYSFSRPSDDHVGVALETGRVLPALNVTYDLGDSVEHADRYSGVGPSALPDLVEGQVYDPFKRRSRRHQPQPPLRVESQG
jgi:hypothetical protein